MTGETHALAAERRGDMLHFKASFGPAGSKIYVVDPQGTAAAPARRPALFAVAGHRARRRAGGVHWPGLPLQPHRSYILTLDQCRYRLNDGE